MSNKVSWDQIWMDMACIISKKSPDEQTKVGAVIIDRHNHIKSVGFNGFMSKIDDSSLPRTRPDKYPWMIHAEMNAILFCEHRPVDCILYCTHSPCLSCFQHIINAGISEIVYIGDSFAAFTLSNEYSKLVEKAVELTKDLVTIRKIDFDRL